MIQLHPIFRHARIRVEAMTPLSVTTGVSDNTYDTALVRDVNGLPALPATALKGVLRDLFLRHVCDGDRDDLLLRDLFGFVDGDDGAPARISVSWGAVHDSCDRPVDGVLMPGGDLTPSRFTDNWDLSDALLRWLLEDMQREPVVRDHVRLTSLGVADAGKSGKFDRTVLPAGFRFTFDLVLTGSDEPEARARDDAAFEALLRLVAGGELRVGGATHSGLGLLRPCADAVSAHAPILISRYNLREPADLERYRQAASSLVRLDQVPLHGEPAPASGEFYLVGTTTLRLSLSARDLWRIGGGSRSFLTETGGKVADDLPLSEPRLTWTRQHNSVVAELPRGKPARRILLPGSSIKGALRHRCAFHFNRLTGTFADPEGRIGEDHTDRNPGVIALFGSAKDDGSGRAGRVRIDDVFLDRDDVAFTGLTHNSIDRFSGGVRDKLLFDEQLVVGGQIEVVVQIEPRRTASSGPEEDRIDSLALEALHLAINDLLADELMLGAGSTKGHGRFRGTRAEAETAR